MNLHVSIAGMGRIKAKLARLAANVKDPRVPMMQAAVQITEETQRNFEAGGRPEAWAPLSLMSLFIRAHRADGPRRSGSAVPLSDTGRLKSSFVPFVGSAATGFGTATNVEYASLMQNGGISEAQDIPIKGFRRKLARTRNALPAWALKKRGKYTGTGMVKDYVLHLSGGAEIPARPFLPRTLQELISWGYQSKIKRIFWQFYNKDL